ncbi:MAG: carboxypeptidase regulatory-like domain-containing protein, partial [Calditrichaeota bacterium]|nr:carboxypeptidase regulatory-like domain-containing protein [Calditrichota bacterium]
MFKLLKITLFAVSLKVLFNTLSAIAAVTIEPFGAAFSIAENGQAESELLLVNDYNFTVEFALKYRLIVDDDERLAGPQRDNPGDIIRRYQLPLAYYTTIGLAWDADHNWMWGLEWTNRRLLALNLANGQVPINIALNAGMVGLFLSEGVLYAGGYSANPNTIFRFDTQGQALENLRINRNLTDTHIGGDDRYIYTVAYQRGGGQGDVHVFDRQDNMREVAVIDCREGIGVDVWGLEVIRVHNNGWLWLCNRDRMFQYEVDNQWRARLVLQFATVAANVGGSHCGLAHDGENLWRGVYGVNDNTWYVIDDGVREFDMLTFDAENGIIPADSSTTIILSLDAEGYEAGIYNVTLTIELGDAENEQNELDPNLIQISVVISVASPVVNIAGTITNAANRNPLAGASAELDRYLISRLSDNEGYYALPNLPLGEYQITYSAPDYLTHTEQVELDEAGEVDLNIAMLHSTCTPDVEELFTQLEPGGETDMDFSIANNGNGPLTYRVERRLLGEANAAPWELRRNYAIGNLLNDDRIEGVAFDGVNFFVSGAAGQNPNAIYVVNREGERVDAFVQPGESNYGMKDLEWDGELLWGSGEQRVFG